MKFLILLALAATTTVAIGCKRQQGANDDKAGLGLQVGQVIDEAELVRAIGDKAKGMRYILKMENGDDTIIFKGTVGQAFNAGK